jgi:hypothetical protein
MAARKVTDVDLLRSILSLRDRDVRATARNVADDVGMTPSAIHRRLSLLFDRDVLGMDVRGYYLKPSALDLTGTFKEGAVTLVWQTGKDGEIFVIPAATA